MRGEPGSGDSTTQPGSLGAAERCQGFIFFLWDNLYQSQQKKTCANTVLTFVVIVVVFIIIIADAAVPAASAAGGRDGRGGQLDQSGRRHDCVPGGSQGALGHVAGATGGVHGGATPQAPPVLEPGKQWHNILPYVLPYI